MRSLAARLVATYVALIVAMTAVAGVAIIGLTRKYFVDAERKSILVQARVVAQSCNDACVASGGARLTLDQDALPPASNISRNQQNVSSDYSVDPNGLTTEQSLQALVPSNIVVFASKSNSSALSQSVIAALTGRESTTLSQGNVVAVVPIRKGGTVVGAVQATGSLDDVQSVIDDVKRQVLLALIASAVVATLIGVWRARAIAKPVRALTSAANQLSSGYFDAPLPPVRSADELGELTTAFDTLRNTVQSELQARSAFVGDASHELRTPLTAMRGAVEILRSDAGNRPEVRERFLASLDTEMNRLLKLVEDLLTLNESDHSTHTAHDGPISIDELVNEVVRDLAPLSAKRNIDIRCNPGFDDALVVGQRSALRQLFINVIDNAMIHAPLGKTIDVSLNNVEVPPQVVVDIRDYGPGIAPEDRERVFERFARLDSARSRESGGAGLGLAIARTIARHHGGDVVYLDPPDGGPGIVARITVKTSQTV